MAVQVGSGEGDSGFFHESCHRDRRAKTGRRCLHARPQSSVADDKQSRVRISRYDFVEGADEVNDTGDLSGVFERPNKHQDWEGAIEVVFVRPALSLSRINRDHSSRRP